MSTLPNYSGDILTARPKKMSYEEYVTQRKLQTKILKARVKEGFIFYKSWEWVEDNLYNKLLRKYKPYVKKK